MTCSASVQVSRDWDGWMDRRTDGRMNGLENWRARGRLEGPRAEDRQTEPGDKEDKASTWDCGRVRGAEETVTGAMMKIHCSPRAAIHLR